MGVAVISISLLLALLPFAIVSGAERSGDFRAGAAKVVITPPFPTQMGGYFDRTELARGVHDDLHARALVLDDGGTVLAIAACELLLVDSDLVSEIRRIASEGSGIPPDNIMVCASHTHSGPQGYSAGFGVMRGRYLPELRDYLARKIAYSILLAYEDLRPARFGFSFGKLPEIQSNRFDPKGPIDPEVGVIRIDRGDGGPMAAVVNFTGHPVIMGSENLLYSSEYPGHAMSVIESVEGGNFVSLFLQGASGNITVRRRGGYFSEVARLGRMLAGETLRTFEGISTSPDVRLKSARRTLALKVRRFPPPEEARSKLRELKARLTEAQGEGDRKLVGRLKKELARAEGDLFYSANWTRIPKIASGSVETEVQVFSIGGLFLISCPGEPFVEFGLAAKEAAAPAFFVGYANDYTGYIVTREASSIGGYEAGMSPLDPESGYMIVDTISEMMGALGGPKP